MIGLLYHSQILYDNGKDSGFFKDGKIRPDTSAEGHRNKYSCDGPHYDDDAVKKAEEALKKDWNQDWNLLLNNCQDYTDAVIDLLPKMRHQ